MFAYIFIHYVSAHSVGRGRGNIATIPNYAFGMREHY